MKKFILSSLILLGALTSSIMAQNESSIPSESARGLSIGGAVYANFFSSIIQSSAPIGSSVSFENENTAKGIELESGTTTNIEFKHSGIYSISYVAVGAGTYALFLNGKQIPGSDGVLGVQQVIVPVKRKDILQLRLIALPLPPGPPIDPTAFSLNIIKIDNLKKESRSSR